MSLKHLIVLPLALALGQADWAQIPTGRPEVQCKDAPDFGDPTTGGGGGGAGSCGCNDTCDLAIIMSDGQGGEVRCNYSGCEVRSIAFNKILVCKYKNPVDGKTYERSGGRCN